MKTAIVSLVLFVSIVTNANAQSMACQPSGIDYRVAVQRSIRYFVDHPDLIKISPKSGSLRISVLPEEFKDINGSSYELLQTVRMSYYHFGDQQGVLADQYLFTHTTNPNCTNFSGSKVETKISVPSFESDTILSKVALFALDRFSSEISNLPQNNHSGSHSLKVRVPTQCTTNSTDFNVLIQRTQMVAGRTVSKIFKYVINSETGQILKQSNAAGWFLDETCE